MHKLYPVAILKWLLLLFLSQPLFAQPVIQSFAPVSGPIGTAVTITGTGFSTVLADNAVFFGAVKANVTAASATALTVTVPAGATFAPVSVTVNRLTAYSARPFMITFPGAAPISYGSFAIPDNLTSGSAPYAVAITDLDGDGKPDLAAACSANVPASVLSLFKNTGTGNALSFSTKIDVTTADVPYAMAAGDFDGDGKPDLAVTYNSGGGNVAIYKNTSVPGTLSLAGPITYAAGSTPFRILVSDIDSDGKPDLVISNYLGSSIAVLRNTSANGVISFAQKIDIPTIVTPNSIGVADFDGDGKPDLVAGGGIGLMVNMCIHRNTSTPGAISFGTRKDFTNESGPLGLTTGDIDNDGKPDLVAVYFTTLEILRNTSGVGAFSFDAPVRYTTAPLSGAADLTMGDLDGDALPDIVLGNSDGIITIRKNASSSGAVSFHAEQSYGNVSAFRVAIGDLNADAKPELVVPDFIGNTIGIFRNRVNEPFVYDFDPVEAWQGSTVTIKGNNFLGATAVSFGGVPAASFTIVSADSITAVVGNGASGQIAVSNIYGTSKADGFTFLSPPVITAFTPTAAKTGDTVIIKGNFFTGATAVSFGGTPATSFTVDSPTSITTVVAAGSSGSIVVTTKYGTVASSGFTWYPPPTITSFTPVAGDKGTVITITGDNFTGTSKVLVGGAPVTSFTVQSATSITAVINEGAAGSIMVQARGGTAVSADAFAFPPPAVISFSPLTGPVGTTVTITGSNFRSDASANHVFFGAVKAKVTAASRTSLTVMVPTGATYAPLTVTVNNQTAFANKPFNITYIGGDTSITINSFVWKGGGKTGEGIRYVSMADLDVDGKPDMLYRASESDDDGVSVLRNTSTSGVVSFAPYQNIARFYSPQDVVAGDLNGDGKPDVIANDFYGRLYISRNTSTPGNMSFDQAIGFSAGIFRGGILTNDFDGDGKTDIVGSIVNDPVMGGNFALAALRNTSINGNITFAPRVSLPLISSYAYFMAAADFNNDGKPDIAFIHDYNELIVLKNTSTPGNISFASGINIPIQGVSGLTVADFDNDQKQDIALSGPAGSGIAIYKNTGTGGSIGFTPVFNYPTDMVQDYITTGQLDGDGLPDLAVTSERGILVYRNKSTPSAVSFADPVFFPSQTGFNWTYESSIGDVDGDGKGDFVVANDVDRFCAVFRNQQGEEVVTTCLQTDTTLTADRTGTKYQWQVNAGDGFANISNNASYAGATTVALTLKAIPESWNNYQYRCMVDGVLATPVNLVVRPTIVQAGHVTYPERICVGSAFPLTYEATNTFPGSTLEIKRSTDGGDFETVYSTTYYGSPARLDLANDTVIGTKKYFLVITPPQDLPCAAITHSDTVTTIVGKFDTPLVEMHGPIITVINPDPATSYTWQVLISGGGFTDVTPDATGTAFAAHRVGTYRVQARQMNCDFTRYSEEQKVIVTAIDPVAATTEGIKLFPNPVATFFTITPLSLTSKWQTLDIYRTDGQQVLSGYNISNKTSVKINTTHFISGTYTAVMRRKDGKPITFKFVKQ